MQQRDVRAYLWDIVQGCEAIERYVRGVTFEDYLRDYQVRSSVERQIFILGEAVNKIREQDPLGVHTLGNVDGIIRTRNVLAHLYFAVQHDKVWDMVEVYVPRLHLAAKEWYESTSP